jgi:rhamnosyltransferase
MTKICVILASYNGSKWIKRQIESILNQKKIKVDLYINDDHSNDNTFEILKKLSKSKSNIFLYKNKKNSGSAAQNFLQSILRINFKKYDYISLSDQDDIWKKNKLSRAIEIINKMNLDCYSSDVTVLFKDGKTAYLKKSHKQKKYDYLFEGGGPGSTFVMKKKFVMHLKNNLKKNTKFTQKIIFHDWYIYFFARINNYKWNIDNFTGLKYRQHGLNELGANIGAKIKIKRILYILNSNFLNQIKYFFLLNKDKRKYFSFLFGSNKLNSLMFVVKNFLHFRRKNIEKFFCLFVLILFIFRRKSLL